jgi:hypothetical protein
MVGKKLVAGNRGVPRKYCSCWSSRVRNTVDQDSGWGDIVRTIVGFFATLILAAVFLEPRKSWELVAICASAVSLCIVTARNRTAVIYGIVFIVIGRILIGGELALLRHLQTGHPLK